MTLPKLSNPSEVLGRHPSLTEDSGDAVRICPPHANNCLYTLDHECVEYLPHLRSGPYTWGSTGGDRATRWQRNESTSPAPEQI